MRGGCASDIGLHRHLLRNLRKVWLEDDSPLFPRLQKRGLVS